MLRMTPLASAIVALLLGIEAYAAEETFDTHFMIGGMKDQQVANMRLLLKTTRKKHVYQ